MKIISFSLYNKRFKDNFNMIINCMLMPYIYKDWQIWIYIDDTIPIAIKEILKTFDYVKLIEMPRHQSSAAMMWRFLPAGENIEYMISRDADSWLSQREFLCVEEWIQSEKDFHIICDHCYHSQKIMGGMWGVKGNILTDIKNLTEEYAKNNSYDQGFLADVIYPLIKDKIGVHRGDQYDNKGKKIIYEDYCLPIKETSENDEPILGLSFNKVHRLNEFKCSHCGKIHTTYIGAILENLDDKMIAVVKEYMDKFNITITISEGNIL